MTLKRPDYVQALMDKQRQVLSTLSQAESGYELRRTPLGLQGFLGPIETETISMMGHFAYTRSNRNLTVFRSVHEYTPEVQAMFFRNLAPARRDLTRFHRVGTQISYSLQPPDGFEFHQFVQLQPLGEERMEVIMSWQNRKPVAILNWSLENLGLLAHGEHAVLHAVGPGAVYERGDLQEVSYSAQRFNALRSKIVEQDVTRAWKIPRRLGPTVSTYVDDVLTYGIPDADTGYQLPRTLSVHNGNTVQLEMRVAVGKSGELQSLVCGAHVEMNVREAIMMTDYRMQDLLLAPQIRLSAKDWNPEA